MANEFRITLNIHPDSLTSFLPQSPAPIPRGFCIEEKNMPKKILNDIIYILKKDIDPYELIYSLRSIEANFPHRKVWFVGGQPSGLVPDARIEHQQSGSNKWELIRSSMYEVARNEDVTSDFFLFNDDFFVMQPVKGKWMNFACGTLTDRVNQFAAENPWLSPYARTLFKAREELKTLGCGEVNYDVHLPMLFNKDTVIQAIRQCSSPQMRSVYGNITKSPCKDRKDVKIGDLTTIPLESCDFLSTNEMSFKHGQVGFFIRERFPTPSRFERGEGIG